MQQPNLVLIWLGCYILSNIVHRRCLFHLRRMRDFLILALVYAAAVRKPSSVPLPLHGVRGTRAQEPERKKRHVPKGIRQCGCSCETGIIELEPVAFPTSHIPNLKCRRTMCGPVGDNGGRRCQITLRMVGAFISLERDGRLICFDCRGHEWSTRTMVGGATECGVPRVVLLLWAANETIVFLS